MVAVWVEAGACAAAWVAGDKKDCSEVLSCLKEMEWGHPRVLRDGAVGWAAAALELAPVATVFVPVVGKRYLTDREHRVTP
jgi:hypothetical protein